MKEWKNGLRYYKKRDGTIISENSREVEIMKSDYFQMTVGLNVDYSEWQFGHTSVSVKTDPPNQIEIVAELLQSKGCTEN